MSNNGQEVIGMRPDGYIVYVSDTLIATHGREKLREELIDIEYIRRDMVPPGYHKIRTNPFNSEYVLVYGPTFEEALQKYLNRKKKHETY